MIIVRFPKSSKGRLKKRKTADFGIKSHVDWRKSATKFLCVKLSATNLWGIHWPNYLCKNGWWGMYPYTWNSGWNWPLWSEIANFRSIFAPSASAVTPSENCSINTNRKSTTRFQWAQDEHRTFSLSPHRVAENTVSKIWK